MGDGRTEKPIKDDEATDKLARVGSHSHLEEHRENGKEWCDWSPEPRTFW